MIPSEKRNVEKLVEPEIVPPENEPPEPEQPPDYGQCPFCGAHLILRDGGDDVYCPEGCRL